LHASCQYTEEQTAQISKAGLFGDYTSGVGEKHEALSDNDLAVLPANATWRVKNEAVDVYVVNRTIDGQDKGIDQTHETLGVFDTLHTANEAAPRLLRQGYDEIDWDEDVVQMSSDGRVCIHHFDGDFAFYLEVQKSKQYAAKNERGVMAENFQTLHTIPHAQSTQVKNVFVVQEEEEWYSDGAGMRTSMTILGIFQTLDAANSCVREWGDSHHNHEDDVDEDDEDEDGKYHQDTKVRVVEERLH